MLDINSIYNYDCLKGLEGIESGTIDAIITDPPYNVSRDNNFNDMYAFNKYKGVDFGEWDKNFNQTEWLTGAVRTLKNDGNVVIFNSWQNLGLISIELESLGLSVKRAMVLKKTNPMPTNRDRLYSNSFEFAIWATKGKWTFNRHGKFEEAFYTMAGGTKETNHPTEKPVGVISQILRVLTNPGQIILDPFMGSGTTAMACLQNQRNYIGFEINPEYFDMAQERINLAKQQLSLFTFAPSTCQGTG